MRVILTFMLKVEGGNSQEEKLEIIPFPPMSSLEREEDGERALFVGLCVSG